MKNNSEDLINLDLPPLPIGKNRQPFSNEFPQAGTDRRDPERPLYKISPKRAEMILKAAEDILEERSTTTLIRLTDITQKNISNLLWRSADKLRMCLPGAEISVTDLPEDGYPEQSVGRLKLLEIQKELDQPENQERRAEIQRLSETFAEISDMDVEAISNGFRENNKTVVPQEGTKGTKGVFSKIKSLFTKNS